MQPGRKSWETHT
jgi:hypothetical protein